MSTNFPEKMHFVIIFSSHFILLLITIHKFVFPLEMRNSCTAVRTSRLNRLSVKFSFYLGLSCVWYPANPAENFWDLNESCGWSTRQGKAKYVSRSMLFPFVLVWYLHIYQMQEQALFAVRRLEMSLLSSINSNTGSI